MKRDSSDEVQRRREAIRGRTQWILDKVFVGRQRQMAKAMHISQSLISRVVNGQQGAGPDFLAALAALPGLNPAWVREGVGEPLMPLLKGTLPVAMAVLPGWPEHHADLLTGQRHPVAEAFDRPSRYWAPVSLDSRLCQQRDLALLPGDLLLLDANRELWANSLPSYKGRLFGVKLQRGASCSYELGRLVGDAQGLLLDLFGEVVRLIMQLGRAEAQAKPPSEEEARARRKAFREEPSGPRRKIRPPWIKPKGEPAAPAAEGPGAQPPGPPPGAPASAGGHAAQPPEPPQLGGAPGETAAQSPAEKESPAAPAREEVTVVSGDPPYYLELRLEDLVAMRVYTVRP
jgi:hypothetical protein